MYNKSKNDLILNIKQIIRNNPKKIKILCAGLLIIILLIILFNIFLKQQEKQKYVEYNGKNLSESKYPRYKESIDKLQENHPNWTFTLFYTRIDWDEVINNEGHSDSRINPLNLIPDSSEYPENWKCEIDKDKTFDNGTWLCASDKAIKHQMDPRNILKEENVFQFKELKYVKNAQTKRGIRRNNRKYIFGRKYNYRSLNKSRRKC